MNEEVVHITQLESLGPWRLKLWFSNGQSGEWDFSSLADDSRRMTLPFRDQAYFALVFLDHGALTWPNGFDWCPDALHADMAAAGVLSPNASR